VRDVETIMLRRLLVAGLLSAILAWPQGKRGPANGNGDMGAPVGPPAQTRFDNIANTLNLTKDQRKTVRTILEDGAREATPLREQIGKSRITVGEAIAAGKSEEELKQVARSSSDLAAQLTELELKTFAKVFAVLEDFQKKDPQTLGRALLLMNNMYHSKNWDEL
jgi:Spy/CpxP family protein refolding chaperone